MALVDPVDAIDGALQLGAEIQSRNAVQDDAEWRCQKVEISTIA